MEIKKFESIKFFLFIMSILRIIHILILMIEFTLELSDLVAMQ